MHLLSNTDKKGFSKTHNSESTFLSVHDYDVSVFLNVGYSQTKGMSQAV